MCILVCSRLWDVGSDQTLLNYVLGSIIAVDVGSYPTLELLSLEYCLQVPYKDIGVVFPGREAPASTASQAYSSRALTRFFGKPKIKVLIVKKVKTPFLTK